MADVEYAFRQGQTPGITFEDFIHRAEMDGGGPIPELVATSSDFDGALSVGQQGLISWSEELRVLFAYPLGESLALIMKGPPSPPPLGNAMVVANLLPGGVSLATLERLRMSLPGHVQISEVHVVCVFKGEISNAYITAIRTIVYWGAPIVVWAQNLPFPYFGASSYNTVGIWRPPPAPMH